MSEQQIEADLRDYLEKEPNLSRKDRLSYLQSIFNKHLEVGKLEHQITYNDFFNIISVAKKNFVNVRVPLKITRTEVEQKELTHIAFAEAFVGYLSRMQLLKKNIRFDYTE